MIVTNNVKIGHANITISGMGNYYGSYTAGFDIIPGQADHYKSLKQDTKASLWIGRRKALQQVMRCSYATNSKFTGAKKLDVANNKTDKMTISKLSANKKYYVKVRSYTLVKGTKILWRMVGC